MLPILDEEGCCLVSQTASSYVSQTLLSDSPETTTQLNLAHTTLGNIIRGKIIPATT